MSTETETGSHVQLLTVAQVAQMLGCSVRSVWRMRDGGRIPRELKVGYRLVRWNRAEIELWVGAGCPDVKYRPLQSVLAGLRGPQAPTLPARR